MFAVVMQTASMGSAAQWVGLGLSLLVAALAWVVSNEQTMSAWKTRFVVAAVVALVVATLATVPTYAAAYVDCKWGAVEWWWFLAWGC